MVKVAVIGASGYTGVELLRLLLNHPDVEIACITANQNAGEEVVTLFPSLAGRIDMVCTTLDPVQVAAQASLVFTALPHQAAMAVIPELLAAGCKVIDLSADYRLHDPQIYAAWYAEHTSPELLGEAVYGLPELYRSDIPDARLIANPGCYPTSVALALAPLINEGLVDYKSLVIDSKSGTSGAGRSAKVANLYCEVNEGFKAYSVGSHRHTPEIEQTLSALAGQTVKVTFTPHLLPVSRGILSTCYATLLEDKSTTELLDLYHNFYAEDHFVRVCPEGVLPNIAYVRGANYCDIGLVVDSRTGRVVVLAAIDNLVKGAAGQAVQNMNLLLGLPETRGLEVIPLFP